MKSATILAALFMFAAGPSFAQSAAHDALLAQFKSKAEPTVKDAIWTSPKMLKVGVIDNGTNRDGFAAYVCGEAASAGLKGISVQVIDIAKLKSTGKWVKLGEMHCR
ncbi:hypothetical protein PY257_10065 [Ramlibacter sp. H39-3-26]|uniref:hypothetical protein n=1 Tax=Curvibacter soli TaxID=3031331 RepID=UPI0023DCA5B8|nr:hypothetical protein [Ramlibacter sp. H39-3-26]MDF1485518.1 hypothetical protein [Ramlibacter sp. H39-3-26]